MSDGHFAYLSVRRSVTDWRKKGNPFLPKGRKKIDNRPSHYVTGGCRHPFYHCGLFHAFLYSPVHSGIVYCKPHSASSSSRNHNPPQAEVMPTAIPFSLCFQIQLVYFPAIVCHDCLSNPKVVCLNPYEYITSAEKRREV